MSIRIKSVSKDVFYTTSDTAAAILACFDNAFSAGIPGAKFEFIKNLRELTGTDLFTAIMLGELIIQARGEL